MQHLFKYTIHRDTFIVEEPVCFICSLRGCRFVKQCLSRWVKYTPTPSGLLELVVAALSAANWNPWPITKFTQCMCFTPKKMKIVGSATGAQHWFFRSCLPIMRFCFSSWTCVVFIPLPITIFNDFTMTLQFYINHKCRNNICKTTHDTIPHIVYELVWSIKNRYPQVC